MTKQKIILKHVKTDTFKRYTLDTINAELEVNKNGSTLNPSSTNLMVDYSIYLNKYLTILQ